MGPAGGNLMPNYACCDISATSRLSRRSILQIGGAGLLGLNLPKLLQAATGKHSLPVKAKSVVFLYQFGGPSHLDMFDMKPDAPDGIRGPFKPIAIERAGPVDLRAAAADGEGHGQGHADPQHAPHDEEPQLGRLLRPDRARAAGRRHPAARLARPVPGLRHRRRSSSRRRRGGMPTFVAYPYVHPRRLGHARASTPASSARRTTRCCSSRTRTAATSSCRS